MALMMEGEQFILAAGSSTDIVGVFLQYGAIGAGLVVLGIFARSLILREQKKTDEEHIENIRLNGIIQDKLTLLGERTIETTVQATQAINLAISAIQTSQSFLEKVQYQRDVADAAAKNKGDHV